MVPTRKVPGKSWESYADFLVRKAEEEGAFENLPGAGKPLDGIDGPYDENWWIKAFLKREGLSILPESLRFKAELHGEVEKLWRLFTEADVRRKVGELNARIRAMNARFVEGPALNLSPFDIEETVRRWRAIQANS